jgi:hypothetical protein
LEKLDSGATDTDIGKTDLGHQNAGTPSLQLSDWVVDALLLLFVVLGIFYLCYHPYFFGDELPLQKMGYKHDFAWLPVFQEMNSYKPRLVFNALVAALVHWQAPRLVYAAVAASAMVWINLLLFYIVAGLLRGGRGLAWLAVFALLSSRYGAMLYYDYLSGIVELFACALLLTTLIAVWRSIVKGFPAVEGSIAVLAGIATVFVHERFAVAILAASMAALIAGLMRPGSRRRLVLAVSIVCLGYLPLLLFLWANAVLGKHAITMGTNGREVSLGRDACWCMATYCYNVFLGGNHGLTGWWGTLNDSDPLGKWLGWASVGITVLLLLLALRKRIPRNRLCLIAALLLIAFALIAVAGLVGSARQEARFMFPVGMIVIIIWLLAFEKPIWRALAMAWIIALNMIYILSGSNEAIANIQASRDARSLASSLQILVPEGGDGIIVGNEDENKWGISGGAAIDMGPRPGETFSRVNLESDLRIDPFPYYPAFHADYDPATYTFGLVFVGRGPNGLADYNLVPANTALAIAGLIDPHELPTVRVLGNEKTWSSWHWKDLKTAASGNPLLVPGTEGTLEVLAKTLRYHALEYRMRGEGKPAARLQVNWHASGVGAPFISCQIIVVHPDKEWKSYFLPLNPPPEAELGEIYATLHDDSKGQVELQAVLLK